MESNRRKSYEMVTVTKHSLVTRPSIYELETDTDSVIADNVQTFGSEAATAKKHYSQPLDLFKGALNNVAELAGGVKDFVQFPFSAKAEKEAQDTLAGLEPFFWLLRCFGLCPLVEIFTPVKSQSPMRRKWNIVLTAFCLMIGTILGLGFVATVGFSMIWPIAFCAGFQSIMRETNVTYCQIDLMQRFLTPKGMLTLIQSSFLLIGILNLVTSCSACRKIRPIIKLLREYLTITPAKNRSHSHSRMAYVHIALTSVFSLTIGVLFTVLYEKMLDEMKTEHCYEGYPFADIDTPLVKIENWIAYTKQDYNQSKSDKYILNGLKIAFRMENFFVFIACFAVPAFFSLMCDVLGKAWKTFVAHLRQLSAPGLSPEVLRTLRQSHWKLHQISDFLDECFSLMILFIFLIFIIVNSGVIYIVLKFGTIATGRDRYAFLQALLMFVALEIIFFLVVRQAMRVHKITQQVSEEVRNWQPHMNGTIDTEYLLLLNQTTASDTTFTAWRCFRIDQAAYMNAIAVIFSYVLLLLQYQPPGK